MKNISFLILFVLLFSFHFASAQVEVELTIQNQVAIGSDFQFDLYLRTTPGSAGDLFLGNSDFVLAFNNASFTNPELTRVGTSPGFCTFKPTDPSGFNILFTQAAYFDATSPAPINGNSFIINLSGPTPSNQTDFDGRVAKVDGVASAHRLGTFRMSGYNGGSTNLQWKSSGGGVVTQVFTMANVAPFTSSAAAIVTINPAGQPLPVELLRFTAARSGEEDVLLHWETASEVGASHFEVQRREHDGTWEDIAMVVTDGAENVGSDYRFLDQGVGRGLPQPTEFYYRLRMVDLDGSFTWSPLRNVKMGTSAFPEVRFYPTPATVWLQVENAAENVQVFNLSGKLVMNTPVTQDPLKLDLSRLPAGIYLLKTTGLDGLPQTGKITKIGGRKG